MEYLEEIKKKFEVPIIGDIRTFKDIFAMLMEISRKQRFTLIVDEFQEFYNINPAIYSAFVEFEQKRIQAQPHICRLRRAARYNLFECRDCLH